MAVERAFVVKMLGDASQLLRTFGKVEKDASGIFGKSGLGGKLSALVPSFRTISIAGTAAFGAITAAAGLSVKAAMEDAESQALLAQTLKTTFGESEALRVETERLISQFQKSAAVADDELRPAFGNLLRATGDFTQSQKLLQLALDISAGTGRDLESVTIALARASQGSMTALTRLGVPLDQNAVKAKDFEKVVGQLADTFEGQASVKADSTAGKFRSFGIAVDELREQFGTMLLPVLEDIVDFLTNRLIPAVSLAIDQFRSEGVRAGLAYFVAAFGEAGKAVMAQVQAIGNTIFNFLNGVVNWISPLLVAIDLVRSVMNYGKEITSIQDLVKNAQAGMNKEFENFGTEVDYAIKKLDILGQGPMDVVERRLAAVTRGAKGAKTGLEGLGDGAEESGGKVDSASKKLKSAEDRLREYTSAAKSAKSASDAFGRSQKNVEKAAMSVEEANIAVAKAQQELAAAQMGGNPTEIEAAQRRLGSAERGLARSKFGVEESVIAVRDAERRLAEVRADSSSTADEIRKAEIDLAEAQFNVADSQDSLFSQTLDLEEARRNLRIATDGLRDGDKELVPFQDAVTDAQIRSKEAAEQLSEAITEQAEAIAEYAAALGLLDQVRAMFPKIAAGNPVDGLLGLPSVPQTGAANPWAFGLDSIEMNVNISVDSTIVNADQVAQATAESLRRFTKNNGPLSNYMAV